MMRSDLFRERVLAELERQKLSVAEAARRAGVNYDVIRDLKRRAGASTSVENARAISRAFGFSLDEVDEAAAGFAESVARFDMASAPAATRSTAETLGLRNGVDVWEVRDNSMILDGYRAGDLILVDTHAASRNWLEPGAAIVAQVYDQAGEARTVFRRYDPPALVAAGFDPAARAIPLEAARIAGVVVASWRQTPAKEAE